MMFNSQIKSTTAALAILPFLLMSVSAQADKAKKIDSQVRPFAEANQFAGVVLATENGKVIYEKAFGMANADFKIPNDKNTRVGIASITKLMTAVIRTRLVDEKKLSLEDKLSKYIPDFPNGDKITIEMLSSHRSGIPHRVMPPEMESIPHTSVEMVEKIMQTPLAFEPGAKRLYSSAGYTVLVRVMEIATGKTYAQLLQEYVFGPAGMRDSVDFDSEMIIERRAQDYLADQNGYINAALKDYSFLIGAGSVFGTAADLNRFGQAIVTGKYGESSKTRLLGSETSVIGSGSTNGHRSYLDFERDGKYGYVVLANLSSGAFDIIQRGVRDITMGKEAVSTFVQPKIIPNPNRDLNEFLGKYKRGDEAPNEVILRNGHLYIGDIKIYPTGRDCFFEYKYFGNVCFVREAGKIKEIQWKGSNFDLKWLRQ